MNFEEFNDKWEDDISKYIVNIYPSEVVLSIVILDTTTKLYYSRIFNGGLYSQAIVSDLIPIRVLDDFHSVSRGYFSDEMFYKYKNDVLVKETILYLRDNFKYAGTVDIKDFEYYTSFNFEWKLSNDENTELDYADITLSIDLVDNKVWIFFNKVDGIELNKKHFKKLNKLTKYVEQLISKETK